MRKSIFLILLIASSIIAYGQMPPRNPTPNDTLVSVKTLSDGKLRFSIYAPKAFEVKVQGDFPEGFPGLSLEKSEIGVWSGTTKNTASPNLYTYDFQVDGLKVFDPKNSMFKESNSGFSNMIEIKGAENDFQTLKDVPHGKIEKLFYKSTALDGVIRRLHIYLPPNYDQISKKQKLPVLYLLHGGGDNDASWTTAGRANLILDNLYYEGKLQPMIVVMPAGHTHIQGFFMGAGDAQDPFCREFIKDIVPIVEKSYPVSTKRDDRAIAGLSMGGIQTINLALWHPEMFSQVYPLSTGYFPNTIIEIKEKYSDVMKNKIINSFKDFRIYMGGETDIAYQNNLNMMKMFDEFGIKYKYINGTGAHTFLAWRNNLRDFAPLLFR